MAWTPLYLLRKDIMTINNWLNEEIEIAFLISDGKKKWKAVEKHNILEDLNKDLTAKDLRMVEYYLWHIPSGPLPYLDLNKNNVGSNDDNCDGIIPNPWLGWTEIRSGVNDLVPYFGAGHPGVIKLEIKITDSGEIPMSGFEWIGNHYKIIGNGADKSTEKFWNKLKRFIKKESQQIPRANRPESKKEIYAFNSAHLEIIEGRPCSPNP